MVQNAVHEVAKRAGISLGNNNAFRENAVSVGEHMDQSMANLQNIAEIAKEYAGQQGPQTASAGPQAGKSSAFGKLAVAGALAVGAAVAGPAAPIVAGIGLAVAAKDALDFSTSHAALDGGVGELTMASAAAQFDNNGEMTSYTSACDGVTTAVASGKPVAKTAIGASNTAPARGMHNFGAIIGEVAEEIDPKQFQADLLKLAKDNTNSISLDKRRLAQMDASNDPNMDDYVAAMNQDIKLAVKAPVAPSISIPAAFRLG